MNDKVKSRLQYFCACKTNGEIVLKWFNDLTDAEIYHGAMHLSDATKLAISRNPLTRDNGESLIKKVWGNLPVVHLQGNP